MLRALFEAGYDPVGAAARMSVILERPVSVDSVKKAALRAGIVVTGGRVQPDAPFSVLSSSPDLPVCFKSPPS